MKLRNWSIVAILILLIPVTLLFQNCGGTGTSSVGSSSSQSNGSNNNNNNGGMNNNGGNNQPPVTQPPPTTVGGFNRIVPTITSTLGNQVLLSGLAGNYSGTRTLRNLEITADPGAGESFQTMTLRCVLTGNNDIESDCNNKGFSNNRVRFDITPKERKECLSGTASLRYWVEDNDPINLSVPTLKSQERTITIQIQNTCYSEAKIYPTAKAGQDNFGSTVKMTSNFLFSTAPGNDQLATNSGAVHVFVKQNEVWTQSQVLKVSESAPELKINTLAASGNHLLVGSSFSDGEVGAVFAFRASGQTFSEFQVLKPSTPSPLGFDHFGQAVATDGVWMAIGAPNDSTGNLVARGAVYLYEYVSNRWTFRSKLLGRTAYEQLGTSLSMSADYLVAGAPENFNGQLDVGSAYVYTRSGTFVTALMGGAGVSATSIFGASVAISGSTIIVGAPVAAGVGADTGAAYVYALQGATWVAQQKLQAPDGQSGNEFGISVDVQGANIVVGARRESADNYRKGAAYHYKLNSTTWSLNYKLMALDRADRDYFGTSVSISQSQVVVGSYLDDGLPGSFVDGLGAAYIYVLK